MSGWPVRSRAPEQRSRNRPGGRQGERLEAVDQYRGLAIILMVIANHLADITSVPAWLKHAPDVGLTPIDLIAPIFIFAIGLTFGPSYRGRLSRDGLPRAYGHFLRRSLALIGIGAIISAGEIMVGQGAGRMSWGVLQAIGASGLIALPLLALPPGWRALAGLALLGAYQLLLDAVWLPLVLGSGHGGLPGSLSWAAMLVLATAIADLLHSSRKDHFAWANLAALASGIALAFVVPVSKNRVSASYVLVSLGASGILFMGVRLAVERLGVRPAFFSWWGANPLLLYIGHYLLLAAFVLPGVPWWHAEAPPLLAAAQSAFLVGALTVCAWLLARKGLRVSL
jgi:predicted acyltransferase